MSKEIIGVYKLYKLGRGGNGEFTTDFKNLERDSHAISHEYAEQVNKFHSMNGLFYELDEKANKLYWEGKPFAQEKEYANFEEVSDEQEEKAALNEDLQFYRDEYEKLAGKKANGLWKVAKLVEKINELKN